MVNLARRRLFAATGLVAAIASSFCPAVTHEGEYLALGWAMLKEGPAPIFLLEYLVYFVILFVLATLAVAAFVAVVRGAPRWTRWFIQVVRRRDEDFED